MPSCAMCSVAAATVFCVNDDASLCTPCDAKFHANPLAARHERRPLAPCTHAECSAAGTGSESCDAGVVPQCVPALDGPSPAPFADLGLLPLPVFALDDDLPADFLGGPLDDLPSASDLLDFDFDGVVPTMSAESPLALGAEALFPAAAPAAQLNPFIHAAPAVPQLGGMMVPQERPVVTVPVTAKAAPAAPAAPRARARAAASEADSYLDDEDFEMDEDSVDDDSDAEYVVAPRRSHASRARRDAAAASAPSAEPELSRAERVQRYREKRARRNFKKTIRYQSRKAYAEIRPRIKGRFVSPEEFAAYQAERVGAMGGFEAEAVVPVC